MVQYRVVDMRPDGEGELLIDTSAPMLAATKALGEKVIPGNRNLGTPVCRVYWQDSGGSTNMIRFYRARSGLVEGD